MEVLYPLRDCAPNRRQPQGNRDGVRIGVKLAAASLRKRGVLQIKQALAITLLLVCGCEGKEGEPFRGPRTPAAADSVPALDPALASLLPEGFTLEMVRQGRELYGDGCIVCHGQAGEGTQLGPSLRFAAAGDTVGEAARGPAELANIIRNGIAEPDGFPVPMPPLASDTQPELVHALAAYVLALRHGAE